MDPNREKELIEQTKSDPEAFGVIFDEYYPGILGYVLRRTANVEAARDIAARIGGISCHLFLRSVNPSLRISFFLPINRYV